MNHPSIDGKPILRVKESGQPGALIVFLEEGTVFCPQESRFAPNIQAWVDAGGVIEPEKSDDDIRAELHAYVNVARDRVEQGGFPFNGWRFDSDAVSVARIIGAALAAQGAIAAGQPLSIGWTDADNKTRQLDAYQLVGLQQALVIHSGTCHEIGRQLKAAVEAGLVKSRREIDAAPWPAPPPKSTTTHETGLEPVF